MMPMSPWNGMAHQHPMANMAMKQKPANPQAAKRSSWSPSVSNDTKDNQAGNFLSLSTRISLFYCSAQTYIKRKVRALQRHEAK
jgi:hypothetical protein